MNRRLSRFGAWTGILLLFGAAGCADLTQPNLDDADRERVLSTPQDIESLIGGSFLTAWNATSGFTDGYDPAQNAQLSATAFEHSPMAANFGMIERSSIPRLPIGNSSSNAFAPQYGRGWYLSYSAIRSAADALHAMEEQNMTIVTPERTRRAEAFAKFVMGYAHAHLALLYDSAFVTDVGVDPETVELQGYRDVMDAALGFLDDAIAIAEANTFTLESTWIRGNPLTNTQFVRLIHSLKARFRAQVARSPDDPVDWQAVIDDVDAGLTSDFVIPFDDTQWQLVIQVYHSFFGAWQQSNMFVLGMADQSGAYQSWMATPVADRTPFVIVTPDERFPRGATLETQQAAANRGLYLWNTGTGGHVLAGRGTWRWSYYGDNRFAEYYAEGWTGGIPVIPQAEMRLLKAEGLLELGQPIPAADLINETRVDHGGLTPMVGDVNADCVPKLPDGTCGDLFEAMKWEKRLEIWGQVFGGWYFDSRRWGDLAQGTFLHYPVPGRELEALAKPVYTFGGSLEGSAPVGTYGY